MFDFMYISAEMLLRGAKRSYEFLDVNHERLGLPDPALTLKAPLDEFDSAFEAAEDKETGVSATVRKNIAEEAVIDAFRDYGNRNLAHNPNVTAEDKSRAGWHDRRTDYKAVSKPDTVPIVTAKTLIEREVTFCFWAQNGKRQGKPKNIGACVIRWVISDHMPTSIDELIHVEAITKSPFTLRFKESDRGKRLYFVACWQIERGRLEGPMTAIRFVIIP
jgi:hypothetical protein